MTSQPELPEFLTPTTITVLQDEEVGRYEEGNYRLTTVIPLVTKPELRVYELTQSELEEFLVGYDQYAEFLVSLERLP